MTKKILTDVEIDGTLTVDGEAVPGVPWVQVTQAEYDALTPDPDTLYVVVG